MKTTSIRRFIVILPLLLLSAGSTWAQSTAFTYSGRLNNNGVPVNSPSEFRFTIFDAAAGGNVVAGPLPIGPVEVVNGLFTVQLDFGANVFTGPARWLGIEARAVGVAAFAALSPRQEVTASPYAIRSQTAGSLADGSLTANQLRLGGAAPTPGQFLSYSDGGFIWLDPGVAAGDVWSRNGADAYYAAGNIAVGASTPTPGIRLDVVGASLFRPGNGNIQFGSPNSELGMSIIPTLGSTNGRADLRFNGSVLKLVAGPNAGPPGSGNGVAITTAGNVGIGTDAVTPGYRMDILGSTILRPANGSIQFGSPNAELGLSITPNATDSRADLRFDGSVLKLVASAGRVPPPFANGLAITTDGNVSIGTGVLDPNIKLEVRAGDGIAVFGRSAFEGVHGESTHPSAAAVAGFNLSTGPGIYGESRGGGYGGLFVGRVRVGILEIAGGADLAEPFVIKEEQIAKGSVVVIDEEHPGRLKRSARAYDTRVAGILSGANGISPGISLKQEGALDQGENVALTGRVYVHADAANGPIVPGDLLTTSETPGHAMKVTDHTRAQGAVLGKAMSGLADGKGLVLVLVTLQ